MKRAILVIFVFSFLSCTAPEDDSSARKSEELTPPLDGLQYYLNLKKLNKNLFERENDALINKEKRVMEMDGKPVSLIHSIKLITSGINTVNEHSRQVFLVQEAFTQPDAKFPEHNRHMCTILVFISRQDGWELESNNMFVGSHDEGGTRWTKPCDGFGLSWKNEFPVLVSNTEKVHRKDGRYFLEVLK